MNRKIKSIKDVFSEMIRSYSDPSRMDELGQNLIFKDFTWNEEDLQMLIERGFDINQKDNYGKTPIFYSKAIYEFTLLLLYKADLQQLDNDNRSLLFFENEKYNIRLILESGINLNTEDFLGNNFTSYPPFHQYPEIFTDKLCDFSGSANIFQLYEKSEEALRLLENNLIKFNLSKKITLHYNPKEERTTIINLLSYLKNKTEENELKKTRFIYNPSDDSPAQIYTLHQLSNII
ncbi:hypothetical protein [Pectobacterium carotovorum]|uniref:hypothetical protein n=1 Tax=Pectobacterium carotovorum TaxID=554 RepID=UPI00208462AD|nr:hypothetical protein PEC730217_26700 [Pectobacterium carotovorum subsp. carotovorum]